MFLRNNWEKGYFNGKIGIVSKIKKDSIVVEIKDEFDETIPIVVEPYTWENILYTWNAKEKKIEEKVTGTFTQYPLKLAWAITVHKSQGMTFERVIADVGNSFAAGQVYVALSRCTSLNGLILKSRITPWSIKTDPRVIKFAENEVPNTLILEELQKGKADFYYAQSREKLKLGNPEECYDNLLKAIKYRNDTETGLFKRYVCIWMKWLYHRIEKKHRENLLLSKKLQERQKKIEDLQAAIYRLNIDKRTLEREKAKLSSELDRARKIKWYQKLFGID